MNKLLKSSNATESFVNFMEGLPLIGVAITNSRVNKIMKPLREYVDEEIWYKQFPHITRSEALEVVLRRDIGDARKQIERGNQYAINVTDSATTACYNKFHRR